VLRRYLRQRPFAILQAGWGTIRVGMALAILLMRFLEIVFFTGVAGSVIVVILSFIEDFHELFEK
jgi:hypothetical protein